MTSVSGQLGSVSLVFPALYFWGMGSRTGDAYAEILAAVEGCLHAPSTLGTLLKTNPRSNDTREAPLVPDTEPIQWYMHNNVSRWSLPDDTGFHV